MQVQQLNAQKLKHIGLKIDCESIFHAALHPHRYSRAEHEQAIRAMKLAQGAVRMPVEKALGEEEDMNDMTCGIVNFINPRTC